MTSDKGRRAVPDAGTWGPLAAAAIVVTLPVLVLTVFAQRQVIAELTAGAVKGG